MNGGAAVFLSTCLIFQPILVSWVLLKYFFGATLFDYIPYHSDEWHFWHETLTFSLAGFNGGYYVTNEQPAATSFTHFGPHGPMFPFLYGLVGRIFGWHFYTGILVNHFLLSVSILFFILVVRPDWKKLVLLNFLVLFFWPIHQFSVLNMQESLHVSFGIVFSAFFVRFMWQKDRSSLPWKISFFVVLILASLTRATWSFILIPYYLIVVQKWSLSAIIKAIGIVLAFVVFSFLFLAYTGAPTNVPNTTAAFKTMLLLPSKVTFYIYMHNIQQNSVNLIDLKHKDAAIVSFEAALLIILVRLGVVWNRFSDRSRTAWLVLSLLFPIMAATFLTYDIGSYRDYRVIAPFLLITMFLMAFLVHPSVLIVFFVGLNLLVSGDVLHYYDRYVKPEYVYNVQSISNVRALFKQRMIYYPNQLPWCNTVDVEGLYVDAYLQSSIPAGFGISIIRDTRYGKVSDHLPLKAKYIFLHNDRSEISSELMQLEPIAKVPDGVLYFNQASGCKYP
jgi:hypothetical protein